MKQLIAKYKGPVGHAITGGGAGFFAAMAAVHLEPIYLGLAFWMTGTHIARQTVSWLQKRDAVGKDIMEHMIAAGVSMIATVIVSFILS